MSDRTESSPPREDASAEPPRWQGLLAEGVTEWGARLAEEPKRWLVTGVAGFIGSHLARALCSLGQDVVGIDNFSTGRRENLDDIEGELAGSGRFQFLERDICDREAMESACAGVDIVLHEAALGSVPRSIEHPERTVRSNVDGFLSVLLAARAARVKGFIFASSSSVYGDARELPMREGVVGRPLSPYAASKQMGESIAAGFAAVYDLPVIGLRYFNVFGPGQDSSGAYAAVVPRWVERRVAGESCTIHGDGSQSRDFCFIDNVVQANLLAARALLGRGEPRGGFDVFNVALGAQTTLLELYTVLEEIMARLLPNHQSVPPVFASARPGDLPHSRAAIERAQQVLGYAPRVEVREGLERTVRWFLDR